MRVFLSHSSFNKDFVSNVFKEIGQANSEYDEKTFSTGLFNVDAILEGLNRSDIFALFATPESLASGYVEQEIKFASEFLAQRKIKKIYTFCLGGVTPSQLPQTLRSISAVRHISNAGACARFLKAALIQLELADSTKARPYIGREQITKAIKDRLASPDERTPVAIAISGVDGVGRRTLIRKVFSEVYPGITGLPPSIVVNENADISDFFRSLVDLGRTPIEADLLAAATRFEGLGYRQKIAEIISILENIQNDNETVLIIDGGGLLQDSGAFVGLFQHIIEELAKKTCIRPYFAFVLFRTPPASARPPSQLVPYFRVDALDHEDVRNLISLHVKSKGQPASAEEINKLAELTDGHPYNIQFVLRLLDTNSIKTLVSDPSDLVAFKARRGDEFVARINLDDNDRRVIAFLRIIGHAPIELIEASLEIPTNELAASLKQLEEYHCIELVGNVCALNRPLKFAFERSPQFRMPEKQLQSVFSRVVNEYSTYKDDDFGGFELISTVAKAALFLGIPDDSLKVFLLPSHSIFVGRQLYDLKRFSECARVCGSALVSEKLVTEKAWVEAIRLSCLSYARMGERTQFDKTVSLLKSNNSNEARFQLLYLEGFQLRLQGEVSRATEKFREAYKINRTSFHLLRELSHALMVTGETEEASRLAEEALKIAPTNPYVIDQTLALRVAALSRVTKDTLLDPAITELLDSLGQYGDEEGKSFYAIRMADIYRRAGDPAAALDYAQRACSLTPNLFSAHLVEAECFLKLKSDPEVRKKIDHMQKLLEGSCNGEWRTNIAQFIHLKIEYLIAIGETSDAVSLAQANERRLNGFIPNLKKKLSFIASSSPNLSDADRKWLARG